MVLKSWRNNLKNKKIKKVGVHSCRWNCSF